MQLNLFRIAYPVSSLGPGKRVVIWVAGCRKRCKGCISPEMQNPKAGTLIDTAVLANHILTLAHPIDGITISGGEPFDQAEVLADLLEIIKAQWPDCNVIVYTGYVMRTVRKKEKCRLLLEKVDVVIDGPYRQDVPQKHPLAGSGNQKIVAHTHIYLDMKKESFLVYKNLGYSIGDELVIAGVPSSLIYKDHD